MAEWFRSPVWAAVSVGLAQLREQARDQCQTKGEMAEVARAQGAAGAWEVMIGLKDEMEGLGRIKQEIREEHRDAVE